MVAYSEKKSTLKGLNFESSSSSKSPCNSNISAYYVTAIFDIPFENVWFYALICAYVRGFFLQIMPNFCKSLAAQVKQGIYTSLRQILEKRVLA